MSFITPTNWTRHQGYPQITGSGGGNTLTDEFFTTYDLTQIYEVLPAINSPYDIESPVSDIVNLVLAEYRITPSADKSQAIITLTYQPGASQIAFEDGIEEYFLENNTLEQALEKAKTPEQPTAYLMKWNYDLYEFSTSTGFSATVPAWWATATDKSDADGSAVDGSYAWLQDSAPGAEGDGKWYKIKDRTKPETDAFIVPAPVVQMRKHYKSKKSASTAASDVGQISTPSEVFGISNGQWLVMSASVQRDGKRYLVEKSYQWANEWDSDLYATP